MALDTDHRELKAAELDFVSGGKEMQERQQRAELLEQKDRANGSIFGKGFGGANSLE